MSNSSARVMIDTNVLISAILNENSTPNTAFLKASEPSYTLVLCDQILDELRRIFNVKFSSRIPDMERFLTTAHYDLVILTAEDAAASDEENIRDINDRPILRAARKARIDVFITGDKDFLESTIAHPKIMTAAQFVHAI